MKGVGFPNSVTMVVASRGLLCVPACGGRTGHDGEGALAESLLTWRIKSIGEAAA
jgi:hypothetical protein